MELTICDLTKEFGSFRAVDRVSFTMTNGVYGLACAVDAQQTIDTIGHGEAHPVNCPE